MEIQIACKNDFEDILNLYIEVIEDMKISPFSAHWDISIHPTKESLLSAIEKQELFILREKELLGAMVLDHGETVNYEKAPWQVEAGREESLVLHLLAVSPHYRKRGIAKQMLEEAITYAEKKKMKTFRLDVIKTNSPARNLYESNGFKQIEEYTERLDDNFSLDFVLYEKELKAIEV